MSSFLEVLIKGELPIKEVAHFQGKIKGNGESSSTKGIKVLGKYYSGP